MFRNRKLIIASSLLIISFFLISFIGLYFYSYNWVNKEFAKIENDLKQKGYVFSYTNVTFSGNPLGIGINVENPSFKDSKGEFDWKGQNLRVIVRPWSFSTLHCFFEGSQTLKVPDNLPVQLGMLSFESASAEIQLDRSGILNGVGFTSDQISSTIDGKTLPVYLRYFKLDVGNLQDLTTLSVTLKTHIVALEKLLGKPPLDHEAVLLLNFNLSGFSPGAQLPNTLTAWRDGGGIIDINLIKFTWPPILAEADGTLTLDKEMYPLGSFSCRIQGYQEALTDLVEAGVLKNKDAQAATFVLDLLSQKNSEGIKHLTVPVTLQNKKLSVGPARLLNLLPVEGL